MMDQKEAVSVEHRRQQALIEETDSVSSSHSSPSSCLTLADEQTMGAALPTMEVSRLWTETNHKLDRLSDNWAKSNAVAADALTQLTVVMAAGVGVAAAATLIFGFRCRRCMAFKPTQVTMKQWACARRSGRRLKGPWFNSTTAATSVRSAVRRLKELKES